jgi:hypothetical protein
MILHLSPRAEYVSERLPALKQGRTGVKPVSIFDNF